MPDPNFVNTFKKPQYETTKMMPYNLRVDSRGEEKWRKINEKVGVAIYFVFCLTFADDCLADDGYWPTKNIKVIISVVRHFLACNGSVF